mgnify:CR=1 FL=1
MSLEEYKGVFVFAQQVDNVLDGVAFELLGKGKDLAKDLNTEVTAVLIGSGVKGLADQLAEYGADRVIVVDDPELKEYRTEPYTHALASVINEYKPEISKLQQLIAMISKDVWFGSQKPDGSAEAKQYYKNFEKWFQYMNESNNKSVETA